jgi:hypothetical protein
MEIEIILVAVAMLMIVVIIITPWRQRTLNSGVQGDHKEPTTRGLQSRTTDLGSENLPVV